MHTEEEVDAYIDLVRWGVSPGMLKALYRMNKMIDVREVLPLVRVPTLVLHGEEDQIGPVEVGTHVANRLRSARLVVLPGVGHLSLALLEDRYQPHDEQTPPEGTTPPRLCFHAHAPMAGCRDPERSLHARVRGDAQHAAVVEP